MSYISKTFSTVGDALNSARYIIDEIAAAIPSGAKTAADLANAKALYKADILQSFGENPALKGGLESFLKTATDAEFESVMRALPSGTADELFGAGSDVARRANRLLGAGGITADDINIDNIDDLNKLDTLSKQERDIVIKQLKDKYSGLSPEALELEGDKFFDAGDDGLRAFKKLPSQIQADIAIANPRLRWKAGRSPAGFQWIKGACKNYPVMCAVGAVGGIVGAGFAAEEVYDKVLDDKSDEIRSCIATCLPEDYDSSKVSGYGTIEYKDLKFRTIDDIKTATGNDDINTANTPLCTAAMDPPKCPEMCAERCEDLYESFLKRLLRNAGELAAAGAGAAGEAANEGLKALLDGLFGEGMGIPAMIAIIIVFIVIIILST